MARALRIVYPGAFYHVASRGNERKNIFLNKRDRAQFLSYLESATVRYGALIQCLLPYVQSLPPLGGDSSREFASDHETRKRRLHDIF
jgi:hypothetical protein